MTSATADPTPYREPDPDAVEVPLPGGDVSVGVVRVGATVRRPQGPHSPVVHAVLRHLEQAGFAGAPRFLGVDARGREVLTFVEGEVGGRPRPVWVGDEERLCSVARLLRGYHDAVSGLVLPPDVLAGVLPDGTGVAGPADLPAVSPPQPGTLLGHQDVTVENVVFRDGRAAALIDFDLVRPASPLLDVVNALVWWAPLADPRDRDPRTLGLDAARRCRLFADAYGLDEAASRDLVAVALSVTARSQVLMRWRAETLGGGWQRMWDEGVGAVIARRGAWLGSHGDAITSALLDPAPPSPSVR